MDCSPDFFKVIHGQRLATAMRTVTLRLEISARSNDDSPIGRSNHRPSSCHGIVGSDGTRRCMMRGRATMGLVGFGGLTGFTSGGLPKVRCGFTSRASSANRLASTSSTVRQRFENRKTFTRYR
jgi:hypothetical protein